MVKPSARDFKPFHEANNWVDCKNGFVIALEAQNLTHLVDKSHTVVDPDLDKAQQKHLCKVMEDRLLHHEAKSIVKFHAKTKDNCVIWEKTCKTHDESISTLMNGDAIVGWLASVKLEACNQNQSQGKFVTFHADKIDKFNEMCPDSHISDDQAVCMLQNVVAGVPNLANILNLHRQTRKAAGQSIKISLRECAALLVQQAQVCDNAKTCAGRNCRQSAAAHELDCETNVHCFDQEEDKESDLDIIWEVNEL